MRTCSIEGCGKPHDGRGFCKEHYQQWYRYGDPLARFRARRGTGWTDGGGYKFYGDKQEHISIVERVIGKPLPEGAMVHHWDRNPGHNSNGNLLVCPLQAYHRLIHQRQDAFDACGHAEYRKCVRCGGYEAPERMAVHAKTATSVTYQHHGCRRKA